MHTNNICFCKEVDKSTLFVISQKTTKLLDCALIGACAVIRANTVFQKITNHLNIPIAPKKSFPRKGKPGLLASTTILKSG